MASEIRQSSFATGEIAPNLYGRADLERFATAVKTCLNFVVAPTGALHRRTGSKYVGAAKVSARARLIPFVFNESQAYVLEFGDRYVRFWRDGASIGAPLELVSPFAFADLPRVKWAQLNDVMTLVHPNYQPHELRRLADDDWQLIPYTVVKPVNPPTAVALDGGFSWGTATSDTHQAHSWSWVVTSIDKGGVESIGSTVFTDASAVLYADRPKPKIVWTAPTTGNTPASYNIYRGRNGIYGYVGSSKDAEFTDEANLPDYSDAPPQETDPFTKPGTEAEAGATQQVLAASGVALKVTVPEAFDRLYRFNYEATLNPGETATVSVQARVDSVSPWFTIGTDSTLTWPSKITEPITFYRTQAGVWDPADGTLADSAEFRVVDTGSGSSTLISVSWTEDASAQDMPTYPSCVEYFEQRLVFGGFSVERSTFKASQIGDFNNFDVSAPARDDDAVILQLASKKLDEIRALVELEALVAFTAGAEWPITGAEGGPLTPSSFDMKPRTRYGSSWLDPLTIGRSVLFATEGSREVREYTLEEALSAESNRDLSILSSHLLEDYDIEEWAYAHKPDKTVWMVRADGALLGLTYVREHNVWGWHRHTTDGVVESVCSIPEGGIDATYILVKRTINGVTKRYIERLHERNVSIEKSAYADSALFYDGTIETDVQVAGGPGTLTGGVTWQAGESLNLVTNTAFNSETQTLTGRFKPTDVGKQIEITGSAGEILRVLVTAFIDDTNLTVEPELAVPGNLQALVGKMNGRAVTSIDSPSLLHLQGETVEILVDGATHAQGTVALDGSLSLAEGIYGLNITVGLPFVSDFKALPVYLQGRQGTAMLRDKSICAAGVEVKDALSVLVGEDFTDMVEAVERAVADDYGVQSPSNRVVLDALVGGNWDIDKSVALRVNKPVPLTILSLTTEVEVADR